MLHSFILGLPIDNIKHIYNTQKLGLNSGPGTELNLLEGNTISGCHYLSTYPLGHVIVIQINSKETSQQPCEKWQTCPIS